MPALKCLIGERYGRLLVVERVRKKNNKRTFWRCLCDCGNSYVARADNLQKLSSCGCSNNEIDKAENLVGRVFNRLTVVKRESNSSNRQSRWFCRCKCGGSVVARRDGLINGTTISCGCAYIEKVAKNSTTHGYARTRTYQSWQHMKDRCLNVNNLSYKYYGGRGITVCRRWVNSFENFLEDMGDRPKNSSLDRIDNNGIYEPTNCKWSSHKAQAMNRRTSIGNIVGSKFGRLTITGQFYKSNKLYAKTECICGGVKVCRYENLKDGTTKSCGCMYREMLKNRKKFVRQTKLSTGD